MDQQVFFELAIFIIAIVGGSIGSIIGLGGALIITPLLSTVLGVSIHHAIGASLVAIICTSTSTSVVSLKSHGFTKEKLGLFLALATAIGSIFGAKLAIMLQSKSLFIIFGGILIVVAILSFFKKELPLPEENFKTSKIADKLQLNDSVNVNGIDEKYNLQRPILGFLGMSGAGFIGGLLGIGAGAFKVIAMDNIMRVPFKVSASTSNFIMGITAFAATSTYYFAGYIDSLITLPVALGTLLGSMIGSKLMPYIPTNILKITFFVVIILAALQMLAKGIF
ncbi:MULTISPECIES: sulfite exporter TauE/SafE family protein [unclassified Francisella]|uniref:sulfite exporter TauE/SafE family protein n=1 Tax=unclassified Francisella TaxID=2610885 RepID=UPI002E345561|nr:MULTISPECIES: sulfite exporter TauE/SafE family protein [unclassified Francisella]MED7818467.1 sulfite exporter TauE/SafE family protein [Francisella sp. 19S2-4]MED7829278.1 sulfite exporter TauE/SafE family protein [Francisella sp. 19S2-10]